MRVVDLFAGPGGWDEGLRRLGLTDVLGIEWDEAACATAEAAGHARLRADVRDVDPREHPCDLLIASPPCQAWSMAGKRKGEQDRANCHRLADRMAAGDDSTTWAVWEDDRSPLVCEPVRWVRELRPTWVALEEVPAVASLWEHFARIFRGWGYSVWTGDLNAADYGVPQTRTRRLLMGSLRGPVQPPEPTHAASPTEGDLFGGSGRQRWVSMAEALGCERRTEGGNEAHDGPAAVNSCDEPAPTLDTNVGSKWSVLPSSFVAAGVTGAGRPKDPETQPADTLTGKGTAYWCYERPATTVVGSYCPDVIAAPGYRTQESRQNAEGSVRVTVQEAGVLQSFPAGYPWQGSRTKQFQQVGNAVPPTLAAAVVAALVGTGVSEVAA